MAHASRLSIFSLLRRRNPAHAFALKKYLCGTSPISSTSDNEHTAASLGHSEPLSVQHSVGPPVPQLPQRPEEGTKIPSSPAGQDTGDVLPDNVSRPVTCSDRKKDKHEAASGIVEPLSEPCDGEGLARGSSDENIDICIRPLLEPGHVAPVGDARKTLRQDGTGEGLDLGERDRRPPKAVPRGARGLDAGADGQVLHRSTANTITTPPVIAPMIAATMR